MHEIPRILLGRQYRLNHPVFSIPVWDRKLKFIPKNLDQINRFFRMKFTSWFRQIFNRYTNSSKVTSGIHSFFSTNSNFFGRLKLWIETLFEFKQLHSIVCDLILYCRLFFVFKTMNQLQFAIIISTFTAISRASCFHSASLALLSICVTKSPTCSSVDPFTSSHCHYYYITSSILCKLF